MRALDILELFVDRSARWNPTELVEATGLPRTTIHELLTTLAHRDYLSKDAAGYYTLGVRTVMLGNAYAARFDLLGAANEMARQVAFETGETCSVGLREGTDVFYLAKVDGREVVPLISSVGKRAPASCTALGKVLLSDLADDQLDQLYGVSKLPANTDRSITNLGDLKKILAEVRRRGYATEFGESSPMAACAAAPIRDVSGRITAALSVSVTSTRWAQFLESHWATIVLRATADLSKQLGHTGTS